MPAKFCCRTRVPVPGMSLGESVREFRVSGGHTARVTPVPIPNTEVKPRRADDTARATVWERRSPPGLNYKKAALITQGGLFVLGRRCFEDGEPQKKGRENEKVLLTSTICRTNVAVSTPGQLILPERGQS